MLVFLPKARSGLAALEDSLTPPRLSKWASQKYPRGEVAVALPKFTFTSEYSLPDHLKALGMKSTFRERKADFSGIDGTKSLYVGAIVHKAFVEVNEEGTEAAAATGVVVRVASTTSFLADHPFFFLIRDNASGSILFMGRVVDPQPSVP